jgi:hypothetical protein
VSCSKRKDIPFPSIEGNYNDCNFQGAMEYFDGDHLGFVLDDHFLGFDRENPFLIKSCCDPQNCCDS